MSASATMFVLALLRMSCGLVSCLAPVKGLQAQTPGSQSMNNNSSSALSAWGRSLLQGACDKCNIPLKNGGCKCDNNCDCRPGQGGAVCDKCNFPVDEGGCKCDVNCNCVSTPDPCAKCNIPVSSGGCKCDANCKCFDPSSDPCNQYKSCAPCLKRVPQCKWCLSGGGLDYPHCQSSSGPCSFWFGSGPRECPRDGGNTISSFSCADITSCDACMRYAGEGAQCRWCLTGQHRCMQNAGCDQSCGGCRSWYGFSQKECPFAALTYESVCEKRGKPCIEHKVRAGDTPAHIAAKYGTNTWQLLSDNPLPRSSKGGRVALKAGDTLAVRPAPGVERAKWLWPKTAAALVVGSTKFPRPCAGYATFAERQDCFCHYLPDGAYIWPFSSNADKCRQFIKCVGGRPEIKLKQFPASAGRFIWFCPGKSVVHIDLAAGKCVNPPAKFQCSQGDGCNNIFCFCEEFLLKPGAYLNPFDSTRTTALVCDWAQPGWFGGLVYCPAGAFFDPIARVCTGVSQAHRPYRYGFTSCDGVPDPDARMPRTTGRRRLHTRLFRTPAAVRPCTKRGCCKKYAAGRKYGCLPCKTCREGHYVRRDVAARKGCQCQMLGGCPTFFNRNCRWNKRL